MKQFHINKKDEAGTKYAVRIAIIDDRLVIMEVGMTYKGKRKVHSIRGEQSYGLTQKEKMQLKDDAILDAVPNHLLEEALLEAWEQLKPVGIQFHKLH
jgi:hypothetical protein